MSAAPCPDGKHDLVRTPHAADSSLRHRFECLLCGALDWQVPPAAEPAPSTWPPVQRQALDERPGLTR